MLSILIDTAILAIPNYACDRNFAENVISRAFIVSNAVLHKLAVNIVLLDNADDVLWANGCAPEKDVISEFLNILELSDIFSPNDVLKSYQIILDRAQRCSDTELHGPIDFEDFSCNPPLSSSLSPSVLVHETKTCLCTCAVNVKENNAIAVILGEYVDDQSGTRQVQCRISENCAASINSNPILDEAVPQLASSTSLLYEDWSHPIWAISNDAPALHLAIAIRALNMKKVGGLVPALDSLLAFSIGPGFVQSLSDHQAVGSGRFASLALEVCAQIISQTCNKYVRHMGAATKIVRKRDGAKAMRLHLTDSHEGLRLMYWLTDNNIEFANVGNKHDLFIEEGGSGLDVSRSLQGLM